MPEDKRQVFVVVLHQCEITLEADDYYLNKNQDFIFIEGDVEDPDSICVATVPKAHCQGIFNRDMLIEDDEDEFPKPFNEVDDDDKEL